MRTGAPLDQFPELPKDNAIARERKLSDRFTFVYSGTLSLKHNPRLLAELAKAVAAKGAAVLLRSTGAGADYLKQVASEEGIDNLYIEGFGPFSETPAVFATADVLIALLEPDASHFSVPSKVLSYLCAKRPLLLAVPAENLASKIVARVGAGLVCEPTDVEGFVQAATKLIDDRQRHDEMGRAARAYAEATFDIQKIATRFVDVFESIR